MKNEAKRWKVKYSHEDGRSGEVEVMTEIQHCEGFQYGNGLAGRIAVGEADRIYDLRYEKADDFHLLMLEDWFGDGIVDLTQIV